LVRSSTPEPQLRAGLLKPVFAAVRRLPSADAKRVMDGLADEDKALVEGSPRTQWLHFEVMLRVDRALLEAVGSTGFVHFWRKFVVDVTDVPLLRPMAEGALRLLATPDRMLKMVAPAYSLGMRNLGKVHVRRLETETGVDLVLQAVPELSEPELFTLACRSCFLGVLDLMKVRGDVEARHDGVDYHFLIRWS
jgi:hypothetical protein